MLGPAKNTRLKEGAIQNQLAAALEKIEQGYFAFGSVELVLSVYRQPGHAPAFRSQRVAAAGEGLLLHQELLVCSLPLLLRHYPGYIHHAFVVVLFACCHLISPLFGGYKS